jgi:hypothetical protein
MQMYMHFKSHVMNIFISILLLCCILLLFQNFTVYLDTLDADGETTQMPANPKIVIEGDDG